MRADEPCVHEREDTSPLGRFFFLTGLPCAECEAEAYAAWLESVRARLAAGLEAAAAGERFDWDATADDLPPFALVRFDDRIDLALTIDDDGRCTVPVGGRYSFPRVATLKEAADAERERRILEQLRHGTMTLNQARHAHAHDDGPLFPPGIGEILHGILRPEAQPGPPWVHTIEPPPEEYDEEYDEDGNVIWRPMEPTHTITFDAERAIDG